MTHVQLQDITGWGDGQEVGQVLLPPGARVASFETQIDPQPPKDTGTVRGIVDQPPRVYYRCVTFHVCLSAAVILFSKAH